MILQNGTWQSLNARLHVGYIQKIFLGYDACRGNITYIVQGWCHFRFKSNNFNMEERQIILLIIIVRKNGDRKTNDFSENPQLQSTISERKGIWEWTLLKGYHFTTFYFYFVIIKNVHDWLFSVLLQSSSANSIVWGFSSPRK